MEQQLYIGGKILTMEKEEYAEALLVENGKIKAVGTQEELEAMGRGAECIRLHGAVVMPSFIDAHSHISGYAFSLMQASVEGAGSFSDIQAVIREFIRKNHIEKGKWIQVKGLDPTSG